jgi:hypothetical protein
MEAVVETTTDTIPKRNVNEPVHALTMMMINAKNPMKNLVNAQILVPQEPFALLPAFQVVSAKKDIIEITMVIVYKFDQLVNRTSLLDHAKH